MDAALPARLFVLALAAALALGGCKARPPAEQTAAGEPTAASSEWIEENPTEPAVPVKLPDTPMTNAPASPAPHATPS